jgi:hypothetical protein
VSSTTGGYFVSGASPSIVNTIDRFPFASDGNATDAGEIWSGVRGGQGHQI